MEIKRIVAALVKKHGTRDPAQLAKFMGYLVIYTPLEGIRGFYQYIKRCHIIYINNALDEREAAFVCAHELGHSILHRGYNRIFMDRRTYMRTGLFEWEADKFAAHLLYSDCDLQSYLDCPIEVTAKCLGLPPRLAAYRIGEMPCSASAGCTPQ